jgi:hypothetical protein
VIRLQRVAHAKRQADQAGEKRRHGPWPYPTPLTMARGCNLRRP